MTDKSIDNTSLLINSDIIIGNLCMESFPCQHYVNIKGDPKGIMFATKICKIYSSNNLPIPKHFAYASSINGPE
jgi:hypothetical protein